MTRAPIASAPPISKDVEYELRRYPTEDVLDGCTAAAHIAYACSDAAFIYPITPSSAMAEVYELWSSQKRLNIFGNPCIVTQLQSEAGAAGAVHGSLSVGAVTTTFTASQGLLLMIPPMYKIAGELTPCVFHVSARAVAGQALSIFGDHSDVMAVRQCGWTLLSSASVQEAQDLAVIAHMATLEARVPFIHFFDGFRTSHELQKIKLLDYSTIRKLINFEYIKEFRHRGLNPTHPYLKGAAQGPEVYFQNVEVANKYYAKVPSIVENQMDIFYEATGRQYKLFAYYGSACAEDIFVIMGAGGPVIEETIDWLKEKGDDRIGLITVKLFRPWKVDRLIQVLPTTTKRICVLDRTKEPGSLGEPLFLDVAASLQQTGMGALRCVGGRFGLGSKDFSPAMVLAALENLRSCSPKHGFTVGIVDDITQLSLNVEKYHLDTVPSETTQCMFWGMGSDGTVGANKNVIKILGQNTPLYVQGYFAYSAHKAGGLTVSHLRFGPKPIKSQYLLKSANYVAVHRAAYIQKYDCLKFLKPGGIFVLNTHSVGDELEAELPGHFKRFIAQNSINFYCIDANKVAAENGMGRRINNVLMTSFFKLSGVLPFQEAIALFKSAIQKTYGKKGNALVEANWRCVDAAVNATRKIDFDKETWARCDDHPESRTKHWTATRAVSEPPMFVQSVMLALERMDGDSLPTSAFQEFVGGVIPPGTTGFEKRAIALNIPTVDMNKCTQCNQCSFVCPHAAIRPFLLDEDDDERAPQTFHTKKAKGVPALGQFKYRIQVSPFDCTGCELCFIACPDDALTMVPLEKAAVEETNWNFAIGLPDRADNLEPEQRITLKGSQFFTPMMEFSGACEGCGETPYVKLLTQLFGERLIIANATGCSSIWGASYPANAYTVNQKGFGPAWGNSLFEDNAEYGYGMVISAGERRRQLRDGVERLMQDETITESMTTELRSLLAEWLLNWTDSVVCQRVFEEAKPLLEAEAYKNASLAFVGNNADLLPQLSHWLIGGDGWAYDIGFGGLDHVIASGVNVNVLVLDTEVYSNTGGQVSKATVMGAVHKFATGGRLRNKKDLGAICIEYGDVYVASISSSANMAQTVRAFVEAEAWHGPSVLLAYSPCIEHQYIKPFNAQIEHCKLAVESGYWPLYRYNPALVEKGENPFQLDCRKIKADIIHLLKRENRFGTLKRLNPKLAEDLEFKLRDWALERFKKYQFRAMGLTTSAASASSQPDKEGVWNILYGTETGNAEEVARRLGGAMKDRAVQCIVSQMDEVNFDEVSAMRNVLIVCSTAGQGELPDNAKELYEALKQTTDKFSSMRYAVIGLGDSNYVYFNQASKMFDEALHNLGAHRLLDSCMGDDQHEERYETALSDWLPQFWSESGAPEPKNVPTEPSAPLFEILNLPQSATYKPCIHHASTIVHLTTNHRITPIDYEVDIRHLEFDLGTSKLRYALGDSLAIYPQNREQDVIAFCNEYGWNSDQWIKINPVDKKNDGGSKYISLFKEPMTIKQLLIECLDIFGKPNRSFYEIFWRYCCDPGEKEMARNLLAKENKDLFLRWTTEETVTYADILAKFPSCRPNATIPNLITLVPIIKPRYYSIASSQKFVGETALHLCVGIVEWRTCEGKHRFGQATGFLARSLTMDETLSFPMCAAVKATAFSLPPSDLHPMVIAAMGTGLAPFRAFLQYRAYLKSICKSIGPVMVYFGCRYSKKDFLYKDELERYRDDGVISDLFVAFSRDQEQKHYIQHEMLKSSTLLYRRMVVEDGYFYLCGSAKQVPKDVRNAMRVVLSKEGNMEEKNAEATIIQWQIKGKYNVEAWS